MRMTCVTRVFRRSGFERACAERPRPAQIMLRTRTERRREEIDSSTRKSPDARTWDRCAPRLLSSNSFEKETQRNTRSRWPLDGRPAYTPRTAPARVGRGHAVRCSDRRSERTSNECREQRCCERTLAANHSSSGARGPVRGLCWAGRASSALGSATDRLEPGAGSSSRVLGAGKRQPRRRRPWTRRAGLHESRSLLGRFVVSAGPVARAARWVQ